MEHKQAAHTPRPPVTDAETAWHDTLAAMSATLQDCLLAPLAPRAVPSREIARAEEALREYTLRLQQQQRLVGADL